MKKRILKKSDVMLIALLFSFLNFATAQWQFTQHIIDSTVVNPYHLIAGDIDQDGDIDFVGGRWSGSAVFLWENDGEQHFTSKSILDENSGAQDILLEDCNEDGFLDVVVVPYSQTVLQVYINDGLNNFNLIYTANDPEYSYRRIYSADINGDNQSEIVFAGRNKIGWIDCNLLEFNPIEGDYEDIGNIVPGDLDQDGDMDVVAVGEMPESVFWFENNGFQEFTQIILPGNSNDYYEMKIVDLDSDGDMDIVGVTRTFGIYAWVNDGNSNFTVTSISELPLVLGKIDFGDVDKDGDLDFIVSDTNPFGGQFILFENRGDLQFEVNSTFSLDEGSNYVLFEDMDGDGDLDFAGTNGVSNTVVWWENSLCVPVNEIVVANICKGSEFEFNNQIYYESGVYNSSVINNEGCTENFQLYLTVDSLITSIEIMEDYLSVATLQGNIQWIDCSNNQPIAGATNNEFYPELSGSYAVQVSSDACQETSDCQNIMLTSIEEFPSAKQVAFFPNPTTSNVIIELFSNEKPKWFTLINREGSILMHQDITPEILNMEPYPSGLYFAKVQFSDTQIIHKIIKH